MKPTFDSEQERQTYPIADFIHLIPKRMWQDLAFFNQHLSDINIQLMAIDIDELATLPAEECLYTTMTPQERCCAFLAIILSHPEVSDDSLLAIADTMQLPKGYIYTCAAMTGRIELMEPALSNDLHEISSQLYPSELALSGLQQLITLAVSYGHMNLVERIAKLAPGTLEPIIRMNHYEVFKASADSSQLTIMQRLMALAHPNISHLIRHALCASYSFQFNNYITH